MTKQAAANRWANLAVPPLVLVFSLAPLVWFSRNWIVNVDASLYLLLGSNLILGQGYTLFGDGVVTIRGPVVPGFLGLLMVPLGRDAESLAWAMRLLALANPVLMYFLVRRVSGFPAAGLLAAALVALFGYASKAFIAYNVDAVMLTVYLLTLLALLRVARGGGAFWALLSGFLLGAAILTKETALAALPLAPFAALVFGWRVQEVFLHYAGLVLACLPWWAYVWAAGSGVFLVGPGRVPPEAVVAALVALGAIAFCAAAAYKLGLIERLLATGKRRRLLAWGVVLASSAALSFLLLAAGDGLPSYDVPFSTYLAETLLGATPLWYLLPFAALYVFWEVARGNRLWEFYAALLVVQVPVSLLVLVVRFDTRQWTVPQTLLYGALAALAAKLLWASVREYRRGRSRRLLVPALGAAAILLVSAAVGASEARSLVSEDLKLRGLVNDDTAAAHDMHAYISENVPEGETIATAVHNGFYLAFLDAGRHKWAMLGVDCSPEASANRNPKLGFPNHCVPSKEVAESPHQPTVWFSMDENCYGTAFPLAALTRAVERSGSAYVLATQQNEASIPSGLAWASYLDESGAFESLHSSYPNDSPAELQSYGLVLLKSTGLDPAPVPTRMDAASVRALIRCERSAEGERYAESIRSKFPNGIEMTRVVTPPDAEELRTELERIYGTRSGAVG